MIDDDITSAEMRQIIRMEVEIAEVEELQKLWQLEQPVTAEEREALAAEADQQPEWILLDVPPRPRETWHHIGAVGLAILVAIAYAKFILWLPKIGRLIQ